MHQNKNKVKLPAHLKEIYQKYNNESFLKNNGVNYEEKIETLQTRVEQLEKIIKEKNDIISKKKALVKEAIEKKFILDE